MDFGPMRLCRPWYFHGVGKNRYYANQESVVFPAHFLHVLVVGVVVVVVVVVVPVIVIVLVVVV